MGKLRWDESGPPPSAGVGEARDDSICHLCSALERTNERESGLHKHHGIEGQRNSLDRNPFHQPTEISLDSERSSSFSLRVEQGTCNLKVKSCASLFM